MTSDCRFRNGPSEIGLTRARNVVTLRTTAQAKQAIRAGVQEYGPGWLHGVLDAAGDRGERRDESDMIERVVQPFVSGALVLVHESTVPRRLDAPRSVPLRSLVVDGPGGQEPEPPAAATFVAFTLRDEDDQPHRDWPFVLELADGRTIEGHTDGDGRFRVDPVDVRGACRVRFAPRV